MAIRPESCVLGLIAGIQNINQNYVGSNAQRFHNINEGVQGRSFFAAFQQTDMVYAQIGLVGQILLMSVTFLEVSKPLLETLCG